MAKHWSAGATLKVLCSFNVDRRPDREDIEQEILTDVYLAALRWDERVGVKPVTFMWNYAEYAVINHLRRSPRSLVRGHGIVPIVQGSGDDQDDVHGVGEPVDPHAGDGTTVTDGDDWWEATAAAAGLSDREREVLWLRVVVGGLTFKEIGRRTGVGADRVFKAYEKAIEKVRKRLTTKPA